MRARDLIAGLNIVACDPGTGQAYPPAPGIGPASAALSAGAVPLTLDVRICDLTEDSRTVMPGSLFIARRGEKSDGRAFVPQALEAGAVAVLTDDPALRLPPRTRGVLLLKSSDLALDSARLAERFYGEPSRRLTLIGVTGTNGKTTTTFLIHQMLNALGVRCGLIGTVCIDDGTEIADATLTTPPALEVSRTLARMVDAGCRAAVMEVSSHALHQRRVGALRFRCGVFTNLTGDHLDYHKTMDAYAAAKAMLFESLPPAGEGGVAVLNVQDPWHTRMKQDCRATVYRTAIEHALSTQTGGAGTAPDTVCRARVLEQSTGSTLVRLSGPWGSADVRLPLVGDFNVMNALQAVTSVYALFGRADGAGASAPADAGAGQACVVDVSNPASFGVIGEALAHCAPPPGRLEPVTRDGEGLSVFVDYAHTDDALRTALTTLRRCMRTGGESGSERQLICVFGCGGDRDPTKRPRMGKVASELADLVYVTSDNPRTEQPRAIIAAIVEGVDASRRERVIIEPDREKAIRQAVRRASGGAPGRAGDVVIIAGKGHETYQILPDPERPGQTITRHFDDREVVRQALEARGISPRPPADAGSSSGEDELEGSGVLDVTDVLFDLKPTDLPPELPKA
jgi:UDP-N-acetylmuramoyl-L-alanyl-D-glutamate--2,6-diaminopimelate ligase